MWNIPDLNDFPRETKAYSEGLKLPPTRYILNTNVNEYIYIDLLYL